MSQYLNPNTALERLRNEWAKHGSLIIAFDVDSTVLPFHTNEYKYDYEPVRELLRRANTLGCTLIVFTASMESRWEEIKEQLKAAKIPWHYFNKSPDYITGIGQFGKVYANIYLDDRAGLYEAYTILNQLITEIERD